MLHIFHGEHDLATSDSLLNSIASLLQLLTGAFRIKVDLAQINPRQIAAA